MILLWVVVAALAVYVSKTAADVRTAQLHVVQKILSFFCARPSLCVNYSFPTTLQVQPFDPFEILNVEHGATEKEIKRAYRQASLKYHPDKVCKAAYVCLASQLPIKTAARYASYASTHAFLH